MHASSHHQKVGRASPAAIAAAAQPDPASHMRASWHQRGVESVAVVAAATPPRSQARLRPCLSDAHPATTPATPSPCHPHHTRHTLTLPHPHPPHPHHTSGGRPLLEGRLVARAAARRPLTHHHSPLGL
eukprot:3338697-Prymnesium_polylepis.1